MRMGPNAGIYRVIYMKKKVVRPTQVILVRYTYTFT